MVSALHDGLDYAITNSPNYSKIEAVASVNSVVEKTPLSTKFPFTSPQKPPAKSCVVSIQCILFRSPPISPGFFVDGCRFSPALSMKAIGGAVLAGHSTIPSDV